MRKNSSRKLCFLISLCFASIGVTAETIMVDGVPVEITAVDMNGSGCPQEAVTVTATTTNDYPQAVLLFSQYHALTNATDTIATSDCNVAIHFAVPAGFSAAVVGVDWQGTVVTSPGAFINFHREFFFSGETGDTFDEYWVTPGFINFFLHDDPVYAVYSHCDGSPLIARIDTSATVVGENSLFTLRSADFESKLILTLHGQSC